MQSRKPLADISGFIICKNESAKIRRCIESIDFCKEILVVDSGSTDGTLDIVRTMIVEGYPITLIEHEWEGYARQKQFALNATRHDWCLSLDADEYLDDDLRETIMSLPLGTTDASGFWMRRKDHLPGYGYPPSIVHARYLLRLVRKKKARFDTSQLIHESLSADGNTQRLNTGLIMHYHNMSVAEESALMNRYSTLKAHDKFARGARTGPFRLIFLCIGEFIKTCFGQRYIICGKAGIIHALMRAEYVLLTEAKIERLSRGENVPRSDRASYRPARAHTSS